MRIKSRLHTGARHTTDRQHGAGTEAGRGSANTASLGG